MAKMEDLRPAWTKFRFTAAFLNVMTPLIMFLCFSDASVGAAVTVSNVVADPMVCVRLMYVLLGVPVLGFALQWLHVFLFRAPAKAIGFVSRALREPTVNKRNREKEKDLFDQVISDSAESMCREPPRPTVRIYPMLLIMSLFVIAMYFTEIALSNYHPDEVVHLLHECSKKAVEERPLSRCLGFTEYYHFLKGCMIYVYVFWWISAVFWFWHAYGAYTLVGPPFRIRHIPIYSTILEHLTDGRKTVVVGPRPSKKQSLDEQYVEVADSEVVAHQMLASNLPPGDVFSTGGERLPCNVPCLHPTVHVHPDAANIARYGPRNMPPAALAPAPPCAASGKVVIPMFKPDEPWIGIQAECSTELGISEEAFRQFMDFRVAHCRLDDGQFFSKYAVYEVTMRGEPPRVFWVDLVMYNQLILDKNFCTKNFDEAVKYGNRMIASNDRIMPIPGIESRDNVPVNTLHMALLHKWWCAITWDGTLYWRNFEEVFPGCQC
jgi:hypothetical protein